MYGWERRTHTIPEFAFLEQNMNYLSKKNVTMSRDNIPRGSVVHVWIRGGHLDGLVEVFNNYIVKTLAFDHLGYNDSLTTVEFDEVMAQVDISRRRNVTTLMVNYNHRGNYLGQFITFDILTPSLTFEQILQWFDSIESLSVRATTVRGDNALYNQVIRFINGMIGLRHLHIDSHDSDKRDGSPTVHPDYLLVPSKSLEYLRVPIRWVATGGWYETTLEYYLRAKYGEVLVPHANKILGLLYDANEDVLPEDITNVLNALEVDLLDLVESRMIGSKAASKARTISSTEVIDRILGKSRDRVRDRTRSKTEDFLRDDFAKRRSYLMDLLMEKMDDIRLYMTYLNRTPREYDIRALDYLPGVLDRTYDLIDLTEFDFKANEDSLHNIIDRIDEVVTYAAEYIPDIPDDPTVDDLLASKIDIMTTFYNLQDEIKRLTDVLNSSDDQDLKDFHRRVKPVLDDMDHRAKKVLKDFGYINERSSQYAVDQLVDRLVRVQSPLLDSVADLYHNSRVVPRVPVELALPSTFSTLHSLHELILDGKSFKNPVYLDISPLFELNNLRQLQILGPKVYVRDHSGLDQLRSLTQLESIVTSMRNLGLNDRVDEVDTQNPKLDRKIEWSVTDLQDPTVIRFPALFNAIREAIMRTLD